MKVHFIQHVPFEIPGYITEYFVKEKNQSSVTQIFKNEELPDIDSIDFLVVLGGPMSANDEDKINWLTGEKKYIEKFLKTDKPLLGICLGAQIIANVLGAKISVNEEKEIGWFDIRQKVKILGGNDTEKVFHWHGETFDLPKGSTRLAESRICRNQGFKYGNNVCGIQYHLEMTPHSVDLILNNCRDDLTKGNYIQPEETIKELAAVYCERTNILMKNLLDNILKK